MNIDEFVLIASDRREVLMARNGEVDHVISDSVNKIISWDGGFISGNGYVCILEKLKLFLAKTSISNTDEIKIAATTISQQHPPELSQWKEVTNWIITYRTEINKENISRIGIIKSNKPEELHLLKNMKSIVWAKIPDIDKKTEELNNKLKSINEFSAVENSIEYHISLLKDIFNYGAKHDRTVCSSFDYCYQLNDDARFLSNDKYNERI